MRRPVKWTRKRKALLWIAATAVAVMWFQFTYGVGLIHPAQAVWEAEQRCGCGRTRQVEQFRDDTTGTRVCLSANDRALLLTQVDWAQLGWQYRTWDALDCSGEAPVYVGAMALQTQNRPGSLQQYVYSDTNRPEVLAAYGRADDARVAQMRLTVQYAVSDSPDWGEEESDWTTVICTTTAEHWHWLDGHRYFLLPSQPLGQGYVQVGYRDVWVTALDEHGAVIAEKQIW